MTKEQSSCLLELYTLYLKVIKPLLAKIEATYEKFPTPIYNELRSFIDHIARCYNKDVNEQKISEQLEKAARHINRIILDCYKFLNVYYNDSIIKFEKQTKHIDLTTINNGEFYIKYKNLKQAAIQQVHTAKSIEYCADEEVIYKEYEKSYNYYIELDSLIRDNITNVNWARIKFYSSKLFSILGWILTVVLGSILANNNKEILAAFFNILN